MFKKPLWQTVHPDQTAPIGVVCSGSTLFAFMLNLSVMLGNYLQQTTSADDIFKKKFLGPLHAREPLYSNSAVIAWWSQSTGGKIGVFMCTLLLKNAINFLIFYF